MSKKISIAMYCGMVLGFVFFSLPAVAQAPAAAQAPAPRKPGLYVTFQTNQGNMVCELYEKDAPITVKNFVDLAEGKKEWTNPKTGEKKKSRYYDGLIFHRVIPDFMIQGGDPTGTGMGDPGYKFNDEISPNLKFDKPGRMAMANAGPNTNGSQFFITEVPYPSLDGHYSLFGQLIEGMDVLKKIARVPREANDKPKTPVIMQKVIIERVPAAGAKESVKEKETSKEKKGKD